MFGLLDLLGVDTAPAKPTHAPEELPMKKHKIRELLSTILTTLIKVEANTNVDVKEYEARIAYANKALAEARAKLADAPKFETELRAKSNEILHLKQRLGETERDRDAWKRECERYTAIIAELNTSAQH